MPGSSKDTELGAWTGQLDQTLAWARELTDRHDMAGPQWA